MKSKKQMPDSWEVVRLGDVAEINQSNWNPGQGSTILYLDLTSVIEPGILAPPKELAAKEAPSRARRQVRPGDILVSTVRPNLRGFARVPEAARNLVASTGFAVVSPRRTVNGSFVYQHVMTSQFAQYLENAATGQAYPAVLASDVAGFTLPIPPLPEQRAIAAVLDSIDDAIERTDAVIAATERLRDALLHELLTRGVPGWHSEWKEVSGIGTVPACWEVVRLGDVCEVKGGKRLPKGSSFADKDTGLPYIRVVDFSERTVDPSDIQYLDPDIQQTISRYTIGSSDVYISIAGTIGLVGLVPSYLDGANLTENAAKIVILNPKGHSNYFLMSFLDSYAGKSQISLRVNVLGQPKLALERIRTIALTTPSFLEQRAIAEVLSRIDDAVERGRIEMKVLQSVKASATDALLTGRVRVRNHNV